MTLFRSRPEDASVDAGWHRLPSGAWLTRRPLADHGDVARGLLFCRLTYRDAIAAATRLRARLPTRAEILEGITEARRVGVVLTPVTLSHGPEMVTLAHAQEHDRRVMLQLDAADVARRREIVAGIGKHWVSGAARGRSRICGWPRADGTLIQQGTTDVHDDGHHDYATTTTLCSDTDPGAHDTDPAPPPSGSGERAGLLALRVAEAEAHAHRVPTAARIAEYLRPAMRISPQGVEQRVGIAKGDHCAAAVCFTRAKVDPDVSSWPHAYRCAVWELVRDGRIRGTFRDVSSGYVPQPGDTVCQSRVVKGILNDPRIEGQNGHVGRHVRRLDDGSDVVLEANGPGRAWHSPRRRSEIVGWIVDA